MSAPTRSFNLGNQITTATLGLASQICVLGLVRLKHVRGYCTSSGSANVYLMAFQNSGLNGQGTAGAPLGGTLPDYELALAPNWNFGDEFIRDLPPLQGPIYFALSSTPDAYTAIGGGTTIDLWVEVEQYGVELNTGLTLSKAFTASGNSFSVWTNAQAPHNLTELLVSDRGASGGAQLYLMLFCADATPANGSYPIRQWTMAKQGANGVNVPNPTVNTGLTYLNFGNPQEGGEQPLQQSASFLGTTTVNPTVNLDGCLFAVSTTPTTLTLAVANAATINVNYV